MTETDIRLILEKLDKFEQKLKELETRVSRLFVDNTPYQSDDPNKPYYKPMKTDFVDLQKRWDEITNPKYIAGKIPCMFDTLTPEQKMQPLGLVCRCPKCSPYSVSGSIQSSVDQVWMNPRIAVSDLKKENKQ